MACGAGPNPGVGVSRAYTRRLLDSIPNAKSVGIKPGCFCRPHSRQERTMRVWTWLIPVLALVILLVADRCGRGNVARRTMQFRLGRGSPLAVHHAEVVAHCVGEPFGTLVLALAVTAIETALILSMMIAGGEDMAALPCDAIYAAVMVICNGVVGICVLLGGLAHREQTFRVEGAGAGLAALIVMATLTLVLPVFTTSTPAGTYSSSQLAFVAVTSAALWAIFVFVRLHAIETISSQSPVRATWTFMPSRRPPARHGQA